MSVSHQYAVTEMLRKMRNSIRTALRDFQKCLHWSDTADQEISRRNTGVHSQQVIFHIRNSFRPSSSPVKARRNRKDGITRGLNNVWFWLGKTMVSSYKGRCWKTPVSSKDRIFRGRAAAHRIAEAPGSLHLPMPLEGLSSSVWMISPCCLITRSFWLLTHSHTGGSLSEPSISPNSLLWVVPYKTRTKHSQ